eukprot:6306729-Amphidinium_carterae.1
MTDNAARTYCSKLCTFAMQYTSVLSGYCTLLGQILLPSEVTKVQKEGRDTRTSLYTSFQGWL